MTDEKSTSGAPDQTPVADAKESKDTVAYETYQKVLGEKKNTQAKANELQNQLNSLIGAQKAQEEAKLNESGEYKKLAELKDQKINELQEQIGTIVSDRDKVNKDLSDTWKLQAFYSKLPGQIKRNEYLNFVDLDSIVLDPETKQVDDTSLDSVVSKFMETHGDLVAVRKAGTLPSDAPSAIGPRSFAQMSEQERSTMLQKSIAAKLTKKR